MEGGNCTQARKIAKAQTGREQAFHLGDVVRSQVRATHTFSLAPRYGELTGSLSNALGDSEER